MKNNAKGAEFAASVLDAVFFDAPLPFVGAAHFTLSLHYGEPEGKDSRFQNEVNYMGYRPVDMPRRHDTFARTANVVRNVSDVVFPFCDELEPKTHRVKFWALRTPGGGVKYQGELPTPLDVKAMTRPVLLAASMEIAET